MSQPADVEQLVVHAPDDRKLQVLMSGPAEGLHLLFHTGTPGGLVPFGSLFEAAASRGIKCVLYARPGYSGSDPEPGRTVADAAGDVAVILDRLGAERFVTAGWSGGGPHALATAALLPGRCLAVATIAGVAPYPADGLDWLAGMADENVAEFDATMKGQAEITAFLEAAAEQLAQVTGDQVAAEMGGLASEADREALTADFADYLAASFRAALKDGIAGWRDDDLAFAKDWGFSLDRLEVPLSIWQGDQDAMVPYGHGRWLAERMPNAQAHLLPGDGHLTLVLNRMGEILDELVALAGPQ
jgi:pimeloyl-ACP methyl ester carboxylesterase